MAITNTKRSDKEILDDKEDIIISNSKEEDEFENNSKNKNKNNNIDIEKL